VSDRNLNKFDRKAYRDGYLRSKIRGMIAYQIQALREKTGLNQTDFAKKVGKTQSVISRLEDPEYGRVTIQTLLDMACALDVALVVKFASYPDFLFQTRDASMAALQPDTIQESLKKADAPAPKARGAALRLFLEEAQGGQKPSNFASITTNDNVARKADDKGIVQDVRGHARATMLPALDQAGAA
jgi:transcriptional regulator with XRE-family HTH domain